MKTSKGSIKIVCGFCSGQVTETDENITETHMDMIQILLPDLKLIEVGRLNRLKICRSCDIIINEIFKFKSTCLELEDTIYNYKTEDSKQLDLKKILGLTEDSYRSNQICRTCFGIINNDLFVFICNDNTLIKQHQEKCLSEVDLSLTRKPVMCIDCVEMLQKYFNFISLCLRHLQINTNEKKIENSPKSNTNFKTNPDQHKSEQTPPEYTNIEDGPIIVKSCSNQSENNKEQKVEEEIIVIKDSDDDDEINHFKHQAIKKVENDCLIDENTVMNPENLHIHKNHKLRLEKVLNEEIYTSTIENQNVQELCLISNLRGSVPEDEFEIANKSEKLISNDLCKQHNSETYESQKSVLITDLRESIPSNEFETSSKTTEKVDVDNKQNNNEAYESQKINDYIMDIIESVAVNKLNISSTSTEVKTNGILEQNNNETFESTIINNFIRADDPITKNYSSTNSESDKRPKDSDSDSDQNDNDDIFIEDDIIANNELEAVTVNCNNNSNATNNEVWQHNVNDKYVANETINNHNEDIAIEDKNANDDVIIIENDIDTTTNISPNPPGSDLTNTTEKNNSPSNESNKTNKYKRKLRNNTSDSNSTRSSKVFSSDHSDDDDPDFDPMDELEYMEEYIENKQTSNRRPLKPTKYYYCKSCRCRKKNELELLSHTVVCKKRQTENPSIEATFFHELQQLRAQVDRLERLQSSVTQEDHNKKQKTNSFVSKESEMPLLADTGTPSNSVLKTSNRFNVNPSYSSFKQTAQPVLRLLLTQTNVPSTSIMLPSFPNNLSGFVCSSSNNSNNTPAESQNYIDCRPKSLCTVPLIETAFPETLHTQANSYFSAPNSFVSAAHETTSKTTPLEHTSITPFNNMQHVSKLHNTQNVSTISSSITIISDEEKSLETIDIVDDETPTNLVFMEEVSDNETEVQASELDPLDFTYVHIDDPIINVNTTIAKSVNTASTDTEPTDAVGSMGTDLSRECQTIAKNLLANSSKVNQRSEVSFVGYNNLTENSNDMNSIISDLVNVLGYDSTSSTPEKTRTDIIVEENNDGIFSNIINEYTDCEKESNTNRCEEKSSNEFATEDNHKISNKINKNINVGKRSKINQTKEYNSDKIKLNLTVNKPTDSPIITNLNSNGDDERNVSNNESTFDQNRSIDIPVVSASSISTTNSNLKLSHQFQTPQLTKHRPVQIKVYRSLSVNQLLDKTMLYTVLNHHMIKHYILAVFKCDLCNFNTRYFRLIGLHILTHLNSLRYNENYHCDKCNDRFLNKLKLNEHFGTDHLSYSYKPLFWCVNCAQSFSYEIGIQNHRVSCDRKDIIVKLFKCSNVVYCMLCSFETTNTAKAKMHGLFCKERKISGDLKL